MGNAFGSNELWVIVSTILVISMQAGFCCLESGLVRAKNSINVAIKNVIDFCVASLLFWMFGFGLMFGLSAGGWVGVTDFLVDPMAANGSDTLNPAIFFFFQLAFCGTAVTIVSGAVAERMKFSGYLITSVLVSGLVYPVFGHWAWGGALNPDTPGWLQGMGFVDFAGSTVVHSIGGWISLAAVLVLGPRLGRFGPQGRPIEGHDVPLAALGLFLLWSGWFGFNGGSVLALNWMVPHILVNTLLAAAAGGITTLAISWHLKSMPDAIQMMCGILAGLVAITAGCHAVSAAESVIIGGIGGVVYLAVSNLLIRLQIDDAVDAVPVHLAAGVWGTIAVALFGDPEILNTGLTFWGQLQAQLAGVAMAGFFAFGVGYIALKGANSFTKLRVSNADERRGLNIAEHGAGSALLQVLDTMEQQRQTGDFSRSVPVEPNTEGGEIAKHYNGVLKRFRAEVASRERALINLRQAKQEAEFANASKSQFLANMSHELRTPLNAIIGFSEIMNEEMFGALENDQYKEYVNDIHNSGQHLLGIINDILDLSKIDANKRDLEDSEVNLQESIEGTLRMVRTKAQDAGISLTCHIPQDIPDILGDRKAVRQILINLVSNALKFTPAGGSVSVTAQIEADGRIAVSVADTGIGIAKENISRVLEPFNQVTADNTSIAYTSEGTGLGLPLVVALTRLHGGTFVLDSELDKGTNATVRFPAARVLRNNENAVAAVA